MIEQKRWSQQRKLGRNAWKSKTQQSTMQRKGLNSSRKNRKVKRSDAIERSSKIKPEKGAGALVTWMSLVIEQERICGAQIRGVGTGHIGRG